MRIKGGPFWLFFVGSQAKRIGLMIGVTKDKGLKTAVSDIGRRKDSRVDMEFARKHALYVLGAFIILLLLQAFGELINMKLNNQIANRLLWSGGLVINIIGVFVGLYNIYRGLSLRTTHPLWIVFFLLGCACIFVNVMALSG